MLVFDDIQWGEQALLDLIEHVAFVSSGAPILLVCMARPELLDADKRPGWRGRSCGSSRSRPQEAEQLIHARLGDREPAPAVSQRIVAAAAGNPLFVQELAAMLQDASDEQMALPPTIQAVLAARLDQLDADERTVLEAAAVEGEVFHLGAVQALTPDEPRLTAQLTALVRKEFVRPDRPAFEREDGFRFRHLLLRDATYDAIPKVDPLRRSTSGTPSGSRGVARDSTRSSGTTSRRPIATGSRSALPAGSRRAGPDRRRNGCEARRERRARLAAISAPHVLCYTRAASLPPVPEAQRARLLVDLAAALVEAGELSDAEQVLASASAAAKSGRRRGRRGTRARGAPAARASTAWRPGRSTELPSVVKEVVPIFARDRRRTRPQPCLAAPGIARTGPCGRVSAAAEAWERAARCTRAGAATITSTQIILTWLASATWLGAMPVDAGIAQVRGDSARGRRETRRRSGEVLRHLAGLHGFAGRFELARSLFVESNAVFEDLGLDLTRALSHTEAAVEMLAGNYEGAESRLRTEYDVLEAKGVTALRSTTAALLSRALLAQEREAEAERFSEESERLAEPNDLVTQILWRGVRARLLAARGRLADAENLAREAVALAERTEFVNFHADALLDLASVLEAGGQSAETATIVADALRLYEGKGNTVGAHTARARLDARAPV